MMVVQQQPVVVAQPMMVAQPVMYAAPQPVMMVQQQPQVIVIQQAAPKEEPKPRSRPYYALDFEPKYSGFDCCFCDGSELDGALRSPANGFQPMQVPICTAMCKDPLTCVCGACCTPCQIYMLRKRALDNNMQHYKCCANYMSLSACGEVACKCCPNQFALCCEALCCPAIALSTTRMLVMDQHMVSSADPCDNRLIRLHNCCVFTACCIEYIETPFVWCCKCCYCTPGEWCRCISDCYWCCLSGCLVAQIKIELDHQQRNAAIICGDGPQKTSMQ